MHVCINLFIGSGGHNILFYYSLNGNMYSWIVAIIIMVRASWERGREILCGAQAAVHIINNSSCVLSLSQHKLHLTEVNIGNCDTQNSNYLVQFIYQTILFNEVYLTNYWSVKTEVIQPCSYSVIKSHITHLSRGSCSSLTPPPPH